MQKLNDFIRDIYATKEFIPLHSPTFNAREKALVNDVVDSTFVSSVGRYVDEFEAGIKAYTNAGAAVAVVNGTAALHAAMYCAGVKRDDIVITQALTFVATCNAIYHLGATPLFIDISRNSLGLCPRKLAYYLEENAERRDDGYCYLKGTNKCIRAVVPMHTFGHPVELDELVEVCEKWGVLLIEDAAESLGSFYKGKHTGTLAKYSALSFNGNKIITTGGGGMVLCNDESAGKHVKHITTTAKVAHPYEFFHDEPGFNYRMPNINAALGCAQLEKLNDFITQKRELASVYESFFKGSEFEFISEPEYATSNYWLNGILCADLEARNRLLKETNDAGVMTRPVWTLMTDLPMFSDALSDDLTLSREIAERLVNIPSSPVPDIKV